MGIAEQAMAITPRPNDNRARAKAGISRTIPASTELMRLYADYLTRGYGSLDSDYVFVNLWSQPYGRPWTYAAVYDLVLRLRQRTGIDFEPHQWRHTYATWFFNRDVPQEVIRVLLDHESTQMTSHYAKITDQTVRRHWEKATKVNVNGERVIARSGRAARPGAVGQDPVRHGHPNAVQRLLRPASSEELSACQRVSDLPGLRLRAGIPAGTT